MTQSITVTQYVLQFHISIFVATLLRRECPFRDSFGAIVPIDQSTCWPSNSYRRIIFVSAIDRVVCMSAANENARNLRGIRRSSREGTSFRVGIVTMVDRPKTNHFARPAMLLRNLELCTRLTWNFYVRGDECHGFLARSGIAVPR